MRVPKLCRNPDGRAYATYPKSNKQREYFGQYGSPEAETAYREWLLRVLNGQTAPTIREMTITELADKYLTHALQKYGRDSTEFNVCFKAIERLIRLAGSQPALSIGPVLLTTYANSMVTETYQKLNGPSRKYSKTYVSKCLQRIQRMVRWACGNEILPPEHYHKLQAFDGVSVVRNKARDTTPVTAVDWRVVSATIPFLHDPVAAMVPVQYLCGMRPQDVCNLRPMDIDRSHGEVWIYVPFEHKNTHRGQGLVKAIPPSAQVFLMEYLTDCPPESHVFKPAEAPAFSPSPAGVRYTTQVYRMAILRGCERAQRHRVPIPTWTPNQLRHGVGTLVRERMGYDAASQWLGHASPDTTAIYAERSTKAVLDVASTMDAEVFGKIFRKSSS
jgi:integrase